MFEIVVACANKSGFCSLKIGMVASTGCKRNVYTQISMWIEHDVHCTIDTCVLISFWDSLFSCVKLLDIVHILWFCSANTIFPMQISVKYCKCCSCVHNLLLRGEKFTKGSNLLLKLPIRLSIIVIGIDYDAFNSQANTHVSIIKSRWAAKESNIKRNLSDLRNQFGSAGNWMNEIKTIENNSNTYCCNAFYKGAQSIDERKTNPCIYTVERFVLLEIKHWLSNELILVSIHFL